MLKHSIIKSALLIFLCFLLTSTAWLAWEYHLMDQIEAETSDICTMVIGYLLQAAGIGVFALLLHRKKIIAEFVFSATLIVHIVCMVFAVISPYIVVTLITGFIMNLACGIIAGYYLFDLTENVKADRKATAFGVGYGLAILVSWLLTLIENGALYYSENILIIGVVITIIILAYKVIRFRRQSRGNEQMSEQFRPGILPVKENEQSPPDIVLQNQETCVIQSELINVSDNNKKNIKPLIILCGVLVLLFSLVNSSGFAFPAADLGHSVNVELSRLVYAAGLIIAGIITDKSRKHGAVCALIALVFPFIILILQGETIPVIIFWVLSYFIFGFYAVYRIVLFSDIASKRNLIFLSGFGLMIGRIGDALGEVICIVLKDNMVVVVCLTAILFAITVVVFFKVYPLLYVKEGDAGSNAQPLMDQAANPLYTSLGNIEKLAYAPALNSVNDLKTKEPDETDIISSFISDSNQHEKEKFYRFSAQYNLSPRERDALRLILQEKTNSEIAADLCISENTVKFHVRNILQKTGFKNKNELIITYAGWPVK